MLQRTWRQCRGGAPDARTCQAVPRSGDERDERGAAVNWEMLSAIGEIFGAAGVTPC